MSTLLISYYKELSLVDDSEESQVEAANRLVVKALSGSVLDHYGALAIKANVLSRYKRRREAESIALKLTRVSVRPQDNVLPLVADEMITHLRNHRFVLRLARMLLRQKYAVDSSSLALTIRLHILECKCLLSTGAHDDLAAAVDCVLRLWSQSCLAKPLRKLLADLPSSVLERLDENLLNCAREGVEVPHPDD